MSTEKTLLADAMDSGLQLGRVQGREEGVQLLLRVICLHGEGKGAAIIAQDTGLSEETVLRLLPEAGLGG